MLHVFMCVKAYMVHVFVYESMYVLHVCICVVCAVCKYVRERENV